MTIEALGQENLRPHNQSVVMNALRTRGPMSRTELANLMNLSKTGVANIVDELIEADLIFELGQVRTSARGRPATALTINAKAGYAVGLQIRAFGTRLLVTDLLGTPVARHRLAANRQMSPEERVDAVTKALPGALEEQQIADRVAGIGICIPGFVTPDGHLFNSPSLQWRDVPLSTLFEGQLGLKGRHFYGSVSAFSAMAEYREITRTTGDSPHSVVHFELHVGVGAHAVVDGDAHRGVTGGAGSIGHIVVDPDGPECVCGRKGCVEAYVGLKALLGHCAPDLLATWGDNPDLQIDEVVLRAEGGDAKTLDGLQTISRDIAVAASILANLFDPSLIVLGGYATRLSKWLLPRVDELAREFTDNPLRFRVITSPLGMDAGLIGSTQSVLDHVYSAPLETMRTIYAV